MTYIVELEHIGEGWSGDYIADDPDDEALLRFSVLDAETGEQIDDGSYCTRLPESLGDDDRQLVIAAIKRRIDGKDNIKRICEELSWLDMSDVERLRAAVSS
jgi:hypothetical protein